MPDAFEGPRFGTPRRGAIYRSQAAAFALFTDAQGAVACVEIERPYGICWDLPGGRCELGETGEACVVRECREETGWEVRSTGVYLRARQYVDRSNGDTLLYHAAYYPCDPIGDHGDSCEPDHRLVWLDPDDAIARMRHMATAWVLTRWLERA